MTKYNLSFTNASVVFVVSYSNGQFKRLERKKGTLKQEQWANLCKVIPTDEHHIKDVVKMYQGRVIYQKQVDTDKKSLYSQFMGTYFSFFEQANGIKPKVTAIEGAALKQIITYLVEISATQSEALTVWQQLLSNWHKLEPFYQKQQQIKQINSNIATLLVQLKNGNTKSNKKRDADELRRSL